jgi:hypothetical protein
MCRGKSRRASICCGDSDLVGVLLPEITNCKDARSAGFALFIRYDIPCGTYFDASRHELAVRGKPDKIDFVYLSHQRWSR